MNKDTYSKVEPLLRLAAASLHEASVIGFVDDQSWIMYELNPIRKDLSDIIARMTLDQTDAIRKHTVRIKMPRKI